MAENGDEEKTRRVLETTRRVLKKAKLVEWFEKNCLWARRVDPDNENKLSRSGNWQVLVITGPHTSIGVGSKTFLGAVEMAYEMCEGES